MELSVETKKLFEIGDRKGLQGKSKGNGLEFEITGIGDNQVSN